SCAQSAEVSPRKYDLCPGRADVDADRHQRDVIGDPDRILLQRQVVGKIVIVVRIAVMGMRKIDPEAVIGKRMAAGPARILLGLVGAGHQSTSLNEGLALALRLHLIIIYPTSPVSTP